MPTSDRSMMGSLLRKAAMLAAEENALMVAALHSFYEDDRQCEITEDSLTEKLIHLGASESQVKDMKLNSPGFFGLMLKADPISKRLNPI